MVAYGAVNIKSLLNVGDDEIIVAVLCSWSYAGGKLGRGAE